jgi:hypothetical protein
VFLISSSKCRSELPLRVRILRLFPFHRWFSDKLFIRAATLSRRLFGFKGKADTKLFEDMLKTAPKGYFSRAADCVVNWESETFQSGMIHIHGTNDLVIPLSVVKPDYIIEGGSHNMMMTKSAEISQIIRSELQKISL